MSDSKAVIHGEVWNVDGSPTDLAASGELDLADVPRLDRALRGAQDAGRRVSLDVHALTFIDCTILSVLVAAAARARDGDRRFVMISGSPRVDRLLRLTATEQRFEIMRLGA